MHDLPFPGEQRGERVKEVLFRGNASVDQEGEEMIREEEAVDACKPSASQGDKTMDAEAKVFSREDVSLARATRPVHRVKETVFRCDASFSREIEALRRGKRAVSREIASSKPVSTAFEPCPEEFGRSRDGFAVPIWGPAHLGARYLFRAARRWTSLIGGFKRRVEPNSGRT